MPASRHWRRYLRFWGPDVDADVEDELRFHLEMKAAELEARGLPPEEARREARRRFGNLSEVRGWLRAHDRRRQRQAERGEYVDALRQDVRYGARKLWQQRAFTISAVLVLALGIGAATAMFSAVDAALLRPLPFQHDDRLVVVRHVHVPFALDASPNAVYLDAARALPGTFAQVAAYASPGGLNLGLDESAQRVRVAAVTPELFPMLGVAPALGRGFVDAESAPDGAAVAIISYGTWQRQLGGDPAVLGREVRLNGTPHRVVGVMPSGFAFPDDAELWLPLHVPYTFADLAAFEQYLPQRVVARLAPGVTAARAAARVMTLVRAATPPDRPVDVTEAELVTPLRDALVGSRRTALLVLLGATALVLLVACANVTNLLLARASTRRGEMALRRSLGATRGRLMRQLLVESLLLAAAGALLGVALAYAGLGALGTLMPASLAGVARVSIDARVLGFALVVASLTGLLFGFWPALGASRADAAEAMRAGGVSASAPRDAGRLRRAFVVSEIALALMLVVGAGLLLRSFQALVSTDLGMRPNDVATMELHLADERYRPVAERQRFYAELFERLRSAAGVEAVGMINDLPLRGPGGIAVGVHPVEVAPEPGADLPMAQALSVGGDYFRALGIPLLGGRLMRPQTDTLAPVEAVITATLAHALWPGQDPIGRRYSFGGIEERLVVGVVGDVRATRVDTAPQAQQYTSMDASPRRKLAIVARGTLPAGLLARRMREAVHAVDPTQAVYNVRPMDDVIAAAVAPQRASTRLISVFGAIALVLAALGVYGVIAYGVARRTREIGIRVALGAQRADVLRLVVREGIVLAMVGVTLGLAGAWALREVLASLLYGVSPADPLTFAMAAAVLLGVALLATLLPARQATRVRPMEAIRSE